MNHEQGQLNDDRVFEISKCLIAATQAIEAAVDAAGRCTTDMYEHEIEEWDDLLNQFSDAISDLNWFTKRMQADASLEAAE